MDSGQQTTNSMPIHKNKGELGQLGSLQVIGLSQKKKKNILPKKIPKTDQTVLPCWQNSVNGIPSLLLTVRVSPSLFRDCKFEESCCPTKKTPEIIILREIVTRVTSRCTVHKDAREDSFSFSVCRAMGNKPF